MTKATPTVYIVEGADGTGKTTFANRMAELGARIVHNGPPGIEDEFSRYLNQITEAIHFRDVLGQSTVIDRSFLSEAVYGRYRPLGPRISKSQRRWFERYCRRNGIILLGMEASQLDRKTRIRERGEVWTYTAARCGPDYQEYFHGARGRRFWITADSSSATN